MRKILIFLGIIIALLSGIYFALGDGFLHVTFLEIGQGDSVLVRTPHGQNILIDGGPERTVAERLDEELPFWDYTIDYLILTHADSDHLTGLIDVLRRYEVSAVLTSAQFSTNPTYQVFLEEIQTQKIPVQIISADDDIFLEENLVWNTIYPLDEIFDNSKNLNNQSVVGRLVYGQTSFLFTGDVEAEGEFEMFTAGQPLRSNVLKLSHHGSYTGNTELFLKTVAPDFTVVSAGKNNRYGHPDRRVLQTCEDLDLEVLRTDELGSLHFISDGKTVKYQP